jgi:hypothetical protein
MRQDFPLLPADRAYLEAGGLEWETVVFNGVQWVLIPGYLVPPGYNATQATAALRLDLTYPDSQIDMVYFHPHLARTDGKGIPNLEGRVPIEGREFQQWSRHRTAENPWRPGVDDLGTHMELVEDWLLREFERP